MRALPRPAWNGNCEPPGRRRWCRRKLARTFGSTMIDPFTEEKRTRLRRMQGLATGLLGAMLALLVVSVALEDWQPWLKWVQAFAAAATVGAIADWFAVVALFHHPLGLPLPHTAIVPRNKDRIGESLGHFVEHNFLTAENVLRKL